MNLTMDVATYAIYNLVFLLFFFFSMSCDLNPMHNERPIFFPNNKYRQISKTFCGGRKVCTVYTGLNTHIHIEADDVTRVLSSFFPFFFFFFYFFLLPLRSVVIVSQISRDITREGGSILVFSVFLMGWTGTESIDEQENVNISAQRGQGG